MTPSISSAAARLAQPAVSEALHAAPGSAARRPGGALGTAVLDGIAGEAGREVGRTIASVARRAASGTGSAKKTPTAGYASSSKASSEFAFLNDSKLSLEEKLFRFLLVMAKRSDDALLKKMKEFEPKSATGTSASGGTRKKKKKSGLWGVLKVAVPQLGLAEAVLKNDTARKLASQLSGPVLAAGATAMGLPMLAPLAMQLGPGLVEAAPKIIDTLESIPAGVAGGSATTPSGGGSSGGTTTPTSSGAKDELSKADQMELQRMMEKQSELFSTISNVLRSMHDTKMSIINNIR